MKMLNGIMTQFLLRMKLLCRDRMTVFVFFLAAISFLYGMSDLNREAEERSSIPIGIVNLSDEPMAQELTQRLIQMPSLHVTVGDLDTLMARMEDGYLRCILEIREDYAERIEKGKYKELITVYHQENDNVATVITDIAAGEMMYDVCLARAYAEYEALPPGEKEKYTREQYEAYTEAMRSDVKFDFAFRFSFVDTEGKEQKGTENSLFYRQAVAATAAMLLAMLQLSIMAGVVMEKEQGILRRRRLTALGMAAETVGNLLGAMTGAILLAAIFAACACFGAGKTEVFGAMLWTTLLFSIMMSLIYFICAKILPGLQSYQICGTLLLLVFGACGFCSMVEGVLIDEFPAWFDYVPNCMFLHRVTELLT